MGNSLHIRCALGAALMLCAFPHAQAQSTSPDATLFTVYTVSTDLTSVEWIVCGSTTVTEGCYGSGETNLGTFGHVGAMLEGAPVVSGNTVTRQIYVLDTASGTSATGVTLYVYTETITAALVAQTTVSQTTAVSLPLVGGSSVTASMAANTSYLYVGTNQSTQAVAVSKMNWALSTVNGLYPPSNVGAITANSYGFVTVTYGTPGNSTGWVVYDPNGNFWGGGNGFSFILDTTNAVIR